MTIITDKNNDQYENSEHHHDHCNHNCDKDTNTDNDDYNSDEDDYRENKRRYHQDLQFACECYLVSCPLNGGDLSTNRKRVVDQGGRPNDLSNADAS